MRECKAQNKLIPTCSLGKQLSHLSCQHLFLLVLVNDLLKGWLAWTLEHLKVLSYQENLMILGYWTGLFSSSGLSPDIACHYVLAQKGGMCG